MGVHGSEGRKSDETEETKRKKWKRGKVLRERREGVEKRQKGKKLEGEVERVLRPRDEKNERLVRRDEQKRGGYGKYVERYGRSKKKERRDQEFEIKLEKTMRRRKDKKIK